MIIKFEDIKTSERKTINAQDSYETERIESGICTGKEPGDLHTFQKNTFGRGIKQDRSVPKSSELAGIKILGERGESHIRHIGNEFRETTTKDA